MQPSEIEAREAAIEHAAGVQNTRIDASGLSAFDSRQFGREVWDAGATWKAEQEQRLREFAEYIVWLDQPEASDARRVVTMAAIIKRAKFALSPEQAESPDG